MKKILSAVLALAFTFVFGAAFADGTKPAAAKDEVKKEVCKDKAGKEVKCPEKKKVEEKK